MTKRLALAGLILAIAFLYWLLPEYGKKIPEAGRGLQPRPKRFLR
jgi:hypothetical protein